MKRVVFVSGPVEGVENYWEPFEATQTEIENHGVIALSPTWQPDGMERWKYMRICLAMIDAADAIVLLPGWRSHYGCRLEEAYAMECGKAILYDEANLAAYLKEAKDGR